MQVLVQRNNNICAKKKMEKKTKKMKLKSRQDYYNNNNKKLKAVTLLHLLHYREWKERIEPRFVKVDKTFVRLFFPAK